MEAHVSVERIGDRDNREIRRILVQTPRFSMLWKSGVWGESYPTIEDLSDNFVLVRDEQKIAEFVQEAEEAAIRTGAIRDKNPKH